MLIPAPPWASSMTLESSLTLWVPSLSFPKCTMSGTNQPGPKRVFPRESSVVFSSCHILGPEPMNKHRACVSRRLQG